MGFYLHKSVAVGPFVVSDTTVGPMRLRVGAYSTTVLNNLVPEFHRAINALVSRYGPFPFPSFWGPMAGLPCTEWIARCAAEIVRDERPDLALVYLPHLDYDPQRFGPDKCDMPKLVAELDAACAPLLDAARAAGARVWVVSEYGHVPVTRRGTSPPRSSWWRSSAGAAAT